MIAAGIEYSATGEGASVVCLHGIGGGDFSALQADLPDCRVISWQMPGYGASEPGDWPPSFAGLSDRLGALIDTLDLGAVHLVGHSIGGMIALDHALRRPDQVTSLTLVGTTPAFGGRDDSFKDAFLKARLAGLNAGQSMAEMAEDTAPRLMGPGASPDQIAEVRDILAQVPEATWRGILECLVTFNRRDDLGAVTQPCCLIAGSEDQNAPARTMERMAEKLPDAEYHLLDGIGHMIHQEAPDQVNEIIRKFLGRVAT